MRFRKRPVVIEATQWFKNGDHPKDNEKPVIGYESLLLKEFSPQHQQERDWEGQVVRRYRTPALDGGTVCKRCGRTMHEHGWIDTLEGNMLVCPGDWVITGAYGEYYPCKPDIFLATYDPVEETGYTLTDVSLVSDPPSAYRIVPKRE